MDTATKITLWLCGVVVSLFGLASMPAEPTVETQPPVATVWQQHEYNEIPAEANRPVEALSSPVETTNPPTTTTTAPKPKTAPKNECNYALQAALNVGWPADQMARLAVVLWRESRCTPGPVLNAKDPLGGSYGLLQINGFWCQPTKSNPTPWLQQRKLITECVDLYGTETNLRAGLAIWRNSGWIPWGYSD